MEATLDVLKIHPRVMRDLRARGLSEDEIAEMSPEEAFNAFCQFNGISGRWGHTLATVLDSLRLSRVDLPSVDDVLANPGVSDWAKRTLRAALQRDPVDAANEAELVRRLLARHLDETLRAAQSATTNQGNT